MGTFKAALFLAFKSIIRGNRWALVLIILVMSFSFVNLIFTASILAGTTTTLDDQLINTFLANVIITPRETKYYIDHASNLENRIKQIPGVAGVTTHLNSSAFFEYQWKEKLSVNDRGKSGTWQVIGIDPAQEASVTVIHNEIISGSYLDEDDQDQILLGIEIAGGSYAQSSEFLTLGGVKTGDKVRLTYPNGVEREYTVKGVFQAHEMMRADSLAFVTRKELASVMGRSVYSDRASQILIKTTKKDDIYPVMDELKSLGVQEEIKSWHDYGGAVRSIISSFDVVVSLIRSIGLLVAAIVMFIVIYINVLNKRRQIGILRAIGIKGNVIVLSYLAQALFYAGLGTLIGWAMVQYLLLAYFMEHPLKLSIGLVSLVVEPRIMRESVMGLIVAAMLAGFIPVVAIIRQSIIKAIWGS